MQILVEKQIKDDRITERKLGLWGAARGAGKSTTIKVRSGILRPDGNRVRVDRHPVAGLLAGLSWTNKPSAPFF